jgi:hypothetical protein
MKALIAKLSPSPDSNGECRTWSLPDQKPFIIRKRGEVMQRSKAVRRAGAGAIAAAALFAALAGQQPATADTPAGPVVGPLGFIGCDPGGQIRNLGAPLGQVDFQAGAKCSIPRFDVRITASMYRGSTLLGTLSKRCNRSGFVGNWCMTDHRQFSNPNGLQTYTLKVTTSTTADPGSTPVSEYAEYSAQY